MADPPNPYDVFAAEHGIDPADVPAWKRAIMPPGGIIDRGRELAAKYMDPVANVAQKAAELARTPAGMAVVPPVAQLGVQAVGAAYPALTNAIRPPPPDVASTPAFTRPDEPGTPYSPPPTTATGGVSVGAVGSAGPGSTMTKESELTTTHKGRPVSEEARNGLEQSHVDARLANQSGLEAAQEKGTLEGMAAAQQANMMRAYNALEQNAQQRQSDLLQKQRTQLEADTQAVRSGTIDPNRFWAEKDTGSKIFGLIGMALGGFVAGFNKTENPVARMINQAIERDIHSQQESLATKRSTVGMQQNLIDQTMKQYDSEAKGRLAAHMMAIEGVRTQLQAASANVKNKEAQANAAMVDSQLGEKYAQLQAQFDKQAADDVTVQTQDAYIAKTGGKAGGGVGGAGGVGGLGKQGDTQTRELSENLTKSGIPQARAQLDAIDRELAGVKGNEIPGVGGVHKYAQLMGGKAEKLDNIGYALFGSEKGQAIRQAVQNLENGILKDQSGAAVSDQELMRFKQAMAGARDTASFKRGLEGYKSRVRELEATVRSGFSPTINAVQSQRADMYRGAGAPSAPTKVNPIQ